MIKIVEIHSAHLDSFTYYVVETDDDGEHHTLKSFGDDFGGAYDYWWSLLTADERVEWLEHHSDTPDQTARADSRYLAFDK